MVETFKCDCGNVCTLEDGEEQTEHFGDGDMNNVGIISKCKCCNKILN
ncbi:MAG: hypothetical protein QF824_01320 [Candidatus Woesearchaeota archaeon]|jgi:hypothetical protein|nr:hypothetical protein [Candidatus Woesearchaeota archaeon]